MSVNGIPKKEQIEFPVSYVLKAIIDNSLPKEESIKNLKSLFLKLGVAYQSFSSKLSSNGKYISFSVKIRVEDKSTFESLYVGLKSVPGIKYAL